MLVRIHAYRKSTGNYPAFLSICSFILCHCNRVIIHCKTFNQYDIKLMSHTCFINNRLHCISMNLITNKPQSVPFGCTGTLSGYEILKLKKSQHEWNFPKKSSRKTSSSPCNCDNDDNSQHTFAFIGNNTSEMQASLTIALTISSRCEFELLLGKESQISTFWQSTPLDTNVQSHHL